MLRIDSLFLICNSQEIISFINQNPHKQLTTFSLYVKDLCFSVSTKLLISCIEECINEFGLVAFQNMNCISAGSFLDIILLYLKSIYVKWNHKILLQKNGVSIGSCIAPLLSDLYLAKLDRALNERLNSSSALRTSSFVDDYLVVLECNADNFQVATRHLISLLKKCLSPQSTTHEIPQDSIIWFLDLRITFANQHTCWMYKPPAPKPLLPYTSSHTRLVKRSIVQTCLSNALEKSCQHAVNGSFMVQIRRLKGAGYLPKLHISVAQAIYPKKKNCPEDVQQANMEADRGKKILVIPYMHKITHLLMEIRQQCGIRVVFFNPP